MNVKVMWNLRSGTQKLMMKKTIITSGCERKTNHKFNEKDKQKSEINRMESKI